MDLFENLQNFIQPELMITVPILYLIGTWFKRKDSVMDAKIPLYLGLCGIALAVLYTLSVAQLTGWQDVLRALFTAITQGLMCAGSAVYVNQLIKQGKEISAQK